MSSEHLNDKPLYINYAGPTLLNTPLLNKGSAFDSEERDSFNLHGLLPANIESLDGQAKRCYTQYCSFGNDVDKHIYLRNIQDTNETLFYKLVSQHLVEMMPIIYTPTVGWACQRFSEIYRKARGLFINYREVDLVDDMLMNLTKFNIKVIVMTDGERILGLGDQGIGGMGIPIGKLSLYTACGGISPAYTTPITLDAGTNNSQLLNNPVYMGLREPRISDEKYFDFVDKVMQAIKRRFPNTLIQFEDFAAQKAKALLETYRQTHCCFNDDMQGTAAVTLSTLMAACAVKEQKLKDQRILFLGSGSAGCGIADMLVTRMQKEGLSEKDARAQIFMFNRKGLLCEQIGVEFDFQKPFMQKQPFSDNLVETIKTHKISVLVGVSGQLGLITEEMVKAMVEMDERPIILPLSNPTNHIEAHPRDLMHWTKGKALVATGSPIDVVDYEGEKIPISQCNNSYIFPAIGLGVIASGAVRVSDEMMMAASDALTEQSPALQDGESVELLPPLRNIHEISQNIALAVAKKAVKQKLAPLQTEIALAKSIEENFWTPTYRRYRRYTL